MSSFQVDGKGLRSCGKSWACKTTANNDRSAENKAASPVHEKGWTCQIPALFSLGVGTNISESLVDELFDSGMEKLGDDTYTKLDGKHKAFLNGEWVGVCEDSCLLLAS
ncbi:hypothetical protein OIU79_020925 [Salix purpurea]|uniref:Uncharacterized protein n=1 Tax=Salix purpurea TaxID=77065 RepID=A0A9Q0WQD1_SALPP|nr:hypothetical protein OIU79_020925 [Salix purpurea]